MSCKNIIIKDGLKYKKRNNSNKLRLICIEDGCTKNGQIKGSKYYCLKHYGELHDKKKTINELEEKIKKSNQDIINKNKKVLEENSQTINGIKIYFKNDKKYRMDANNALKLVCNFENCVGFGKSKYKSLYCHNHKNGTDPNSEERLNEIKIRNNKQKENGKNVAIIGDETEKWLCDIMGIFDTINSIKKIGNNGNKLDIIYKMNNEQFYRGIQVKTLVKKKVMDMILILEKKNMMIIL